MAGLAIVAAAAQQINIIHQRGVTAGYCGDVTVGSEAREGCSSVRLVDYDLEQIKTYCSVIESKN